MAPRNRLLLLGVLQGQTREMRGAEVTIFEAEGSS